MLINYQGSSGLNVIFHRMNFDEARQQRGHLLYVIPRFLGALGHTPDYIGQTAQENGLRDRYSKDDLIGLMARANSDVIDVCLSVAESELDRVEADLVANYPHCRNIQHKKHAAGFGNGALGMPGLLSAGALGSPHPKTRLGLLDLPAPKLPRLLSRGLRDL